MLGLGSTIYHDHSKFLGQISLALDGTGDYIDLGNLDTIMQDDFTLCWWEKVSDATPGTYWHGVYSDGSGGHQCRFSSQNSLTHLMYYQAGSAGTSNRSTHYAYPWVGGSGNAEDVWRHYAIQVNKGGGDGGDVSMTFYINGSVAVNGLASDATSDNDGESDSNMASYDANEHDEGSYPGHFYLGCAHQNTSTTSTAANCMIGNIADIAIYGEVLAANSIADIYANPKLDLRRNFGNYTEAAKLVRYYRFTEGSGTTLNDEMGNYNATVFNATWDSTRHPTVSIT